MKLDLHCYANDDLYVKLTPENDTEINIINYFFKGNIQEIKANGDGLNGIYLKTEKKLK